MGCGRSIGTVPLGTKKSDRQYNGSENDSIAHKNDANVGKTKDRRPSVHFQLYSAGPPKISVESKIDQPVKQYNLNENTSHSTFPCDVCHKPRSQSDHYRCLECPDFDMCDMCFEKRPEADGHKNGHAFAHFRMPNELFDGSVKDIRRDVTLAKLIKRFECIQHENTSCDGCETETILGIRFKCDTCPNYDLCLKCMKSKKETGRHTANHPLVVIGEKHLRQIEWDDIEIGEQLGQGGFGTVFKSRWLSKNMEVACKVITTRADNTEQLLKSFIKEIEAYNELSGAFILKIYGYALKEPTSNEDEGKCALIMEFMSRGSLTTVVRQKEKLSLSCKLDIAWNVASGLRKLHGRKMIHRDIRPDNILVNVDYTAKIGDMGIARKFDGVVQNLTQIGCMSYMPPEFWANNYDQSLDVFTYGLTIYYLFTETMHLSVAAPINKVTLPKESAIFNELIIRCIDNDPLRRPSAIELETTFYTYKRAFDKHVEVYHSGYNKLSTEHKNKVFIDFYESFHPSAKEALEEQFPISQSQTHISVDADVVRAMLLMALLQHMQEGNEEEENTDQT